MKKYLSLALVASAVFTTGCASCREKCPFSCLTCCNKTACTATKEKVVAHKPQSTFGTQSKVVESQADQIAKAIAAAPEAEASKQQADTTVTAPGPELAASASAVPAKDDSTSVEKVPLAFPKVAIPVDSPEHSASEPPTAATEAIVEGEAEVHETVSTTRLPAYMPPPPPTQMTLTKEATSSEPAASTAKAPTEEEPVAVTQAAATEPGIAVPASEVVPASATPGMIPVESLSPPENVVAASPAPEANESSELYQHQKDYMWIQGKLIRIYSRGGCWQVRYASYGESDDFGGKFILVGTVPESVKEGDFVRVRGKVLGENRWLNGTEYRIDSIHSLDQGTTPAAN